MPIIKAETSTIHCKIVYYGAGMVGKTSNLQAIHGRTPATLRGDLLSIATETERTLFFDFTPADCPQVGRFNVRFHLYTVPGCVLYDRTKLKVLQGVDGLVFVADSQPDKQHYNIKSLQEMVRGLYYLGRSLEQVPIVLQYNKRDIPRAVSVEVMDKYLNPLNWPRFESSLWWGRAEDGYQIRREVGVLETFSAVQQLVLERLAIRLATGSAAQ